MDSTPIKENVHFHGFPSLERSYLRWLQGGLYNWLGVNLVFIILLPIVILKQ